MHSYLGQCLLWNNWPVFAQRLRIAEILAWVKNSYLTHVILPWLTLEDCALVFMKLRHCYVKVTSLCNITSHIQELFGAYFKVKMLNSMVNKKRNPLFV